MTNMKLELCILKLVETEKLIFGGVFKVYIATLHVQLLFA